MAKKLTKKQAELKAKERKATIIFLLCLAGIIALIAIIAISSQVAINNAPEPEPEPEPFECMRAVTYTDIETGKPYYVVLADGYCVDMDATYLGECSSVDKYGVCYDSQRQVIKRSELIPIPVE